MSYKIRVRKEASIQAYVAHWSESMLNWVTANLKRVISFIVLIVVIGGAFLAVKYMAVGSDEKATVLETEASSLLHDPIPLPEPIEEGEDPPEILTQKERYQKSVELYGEILGKHPDTPTAMIAQYEIGNVYFELEEFDLALEGYRTFIQRYPEKKDLVAIVQLKLGYLQQRRGDHQSARDSFRALYESESAWNRDQAGFELARSLEEEGTEEKAKEIYEKISEDFAQSPWSAEAKARFIMLTSSFETDSSSDDLSAVEVRDEAEKEAVKVEGEGLDAENGPVE
ncbi:MAG: tetratricopeptide repeat protein [Nitrospira sp.]|nr:tetratricopeptide repeat protein [Candidatus Manganitrophaceae bacterium]HIL34602.1 tetratricopeptide repeat protein [Candidatus Manganitrophaceae bacterium]